MIHIRFQTCNANNCNRFHIYPIKECHMFPWPHCLCSRLSRQRNRCAIQESSRQVIENIPRIRTFEELGEMLLTVSIKRGRDGATSLPIMNPTDSPNCSPTNLQAFHCRAGRIGVGTVLSDLTWLSCTSFDSSACCSIKERALVERQYGLQSDCSSLVNWDHTGLRSG